MFFSNLVNDLDELLPENGVSGFDYASDITSLNNNERST